MYTVDAMFTRVSQQSLSGSYDGIVVTYKFVICMLCTGWSRGNACFSHKNTFVDFEDKMFLITQKRRYFNAF
jgi:hypothetical protein